MPDSLKGIKILVTRPKDQAENLCNMIERGGGKAIRLPVIDIVPVPDDSGLRSMLNQVASYDIGIFVSQNAVRNTLALLHKDIQALHGLQIVAIGKSTAQLLKEAGVWNVEHADNKASSEALLELPMFNRNRVLGTRVIIFRGVGGRELLGNILCERGATVDYLEVYERKPCKYDSKLLEDIFLEQKPDYIIVTSNEGLQNLIDMLSSQQRKVVLNTQLLVLGERMSELAIKLGFTKPPVVAKETSDNGLLQAIKNFAGAV